MHYDWILFDADHTLFDFDRSSREALEDTMTTHGLDFQPAYWELYDAINKECWAAYERGTLHRDEMRTIRFSRFFQQIGARVGDIHVFAGQYLQGLPKRPYFIDGAPEILDSLHGRVRLGIITNGLAEVQRPRLVATGIDRYFEVIVVSGEIGHMKPHRTYFEYTHVQMARPLKERVLVVGDSLGADIKGGAEFGFRTCWYNPSGKMNDSTVTPDYEIDVLSAISALAGVQ